MSDLQQAAERLRNNTDLTVEDLVMLAQAYLAEHRADDGDAITDEWLNQHWKKWEHFPGWLIRRKLHENLHINRSLDYGYIVVLNGIYLLKSPTRGQLRQLCRALGAEIKEKTE